MRRSEGQIEVMIRVVDPEGCESLVRFSNGNQGHTALELHLMLFNALQAIAPSIAGHIMHALCETIAEFVDSNDQFTFKKEVTERQKEALWIAVRDVVYADLKNGGAQ